MNVNDRLIWFEWSHSVRLMTKMSTGWLVSGVAMPCLWLWRISTLIIIDDVPDPEFGIDFCSSFSTCLFNEESRIYHSLLCAAIFVPLLSFFSIAYCKMGHFLWLRKPVHVEVSTQSTLDRQMSRKKRVATGLFVTMATFIFCRIPIWIYVMVSCSIWTIGFEYELFFD